MTSFFCGGRSDVDEIWHTGAEWHADCGVWSKSNPEVEFQYGGNSYISAVGWDWVITMKFSLLIDTDLLKMLYACAWPLPSWPWLRWNANRKPYPSFRMVYHFQWISEIVNDEASRGLSLGDCDSWASCGCHLTGLLIQMLTVWASMTGAQLSYQLHAHDSRNRVQG